MSAAGTRLFLFLSAAAVASAFPSQNTPCNIQQGTNLFDTYSSCWHNQVQAMPSFQKIFIQRNPSMTDIGEFVQKLCGEVTPRVNSCVDDRYNACNETVQALASQIISQGVGLICQPGGDEPEPAVISVLDSISEEDLDEANNGGCPGDTRNEDDECFHHLSILMSQLENMPVESVSDHFEKSMKNYFLCWARYYKQKKDTCPYWRAALLVRTSQYLITPLPGTQFPFTVQEVEDLFEI